MNYRPVVTFPIAQQMAFSHHSSSASLELSFDDVKLMGTRFPFVTVRLTTKMTAAKFSTYMDDRRN